MHHASMMKCSHLDATTVTKIRGIKLNDFNITAAHFLHFQKSIFPKFGLFFGFEDQILVEKYTKYLFHLLGLIEDIMLSTTCLVLIIIQALIIAINYLNHTGSVLADCK